MIFISFCDSLCRTYNINYYSEDRTTRERYYFTCKRYVISAKFAVVPGDVRAPVGVTRIL